VLYNLRDSCRVNPSSSGGLDTTHLGLDGLSGQDSSMTLLNQTGTPAVYLSITGPGARHRVSWRVPHMWDNRYPLWSVLWMNIYVMTTFRLAEHMQTGAMTRTFLPGRGQPEMFVELDQQQLISGSEGRTTLSLRLRNQEESELKLMSQQASGHS
jgi:hypothetical protein